MTLYWVSFLVQEKEDTKPWCLPITDSCLSLDEAMKVIETVRHDHRVLSVWIDIFDNNKNKTTVFHECYVDFVGNVERLN